MTSQGKHRRLFTTVWVLLAVSGVFFACKKTEENQSRPCRFLPSIEVRGQSTNVIGVELRNAELLKLYELSIEFGAYASRLENAVLDVSYPDDMFVDSLSDFSTLPLPLHEYETVETLPVFRLSTPLVCQSPGGKVSLAPPFVIKIYSRSGKMGLVGFLPGSKVSTLEVLEVNESIFTQHFQSFLVD